MFFEIDDTIESVITKERYTISHIRDKKYCLVDTFDGTILFLTYHQIMAEFVLVTK